MLKLIKSFFCKKKEVKKICNNCLLYNREYNQCQVVIMHNGERFKLNTDPEDDCFFEQEFYDEETKTTSKFSDDIKQIRFWVEDKNGNPTSSNGIVKMEVPKDLELD